MVLCAESYSRGGRGPLRVKGERSEFISTLDTPLIIKLVGADGLSVGLSAPGCWNGGGEHGGGGAVLPLSCNKGHDSTKRSTCLDTIVAEG